MADPSLRRVPISSIASHLEWIGPVLRDPEYTFWGAAPIEDDRGEIHLFAARWPEKNVDPAWRRSSEIAHYVAPHPEGPFTYRSTVIAGTGRTGEWNAFGPHNPEIKRFDRVFALLYIANSDYHQPPHPLNQSVGMMVSDSLDGSWKPVEGSGSLLTASPDPKHFTYRRQIVNPAIIRFRGQYLLYFKSSVAGRTGTVFGVATSQRLEGPYRLPETPLPFGEVTIEDATVFAWNDRVYLLTTDNNGDVTGIRGAGALWVSDDGIHFDPGEVTLGYDRIEEYFCDWDRKTVQRIYGDPKIERPKILMRNEHPAYLYGPSGWAVHGGDRTACYALKIDSGQNYS